MFITDALALSHVPRWVIVPTVRTQSVAEHSFNVAMIVQEILTRCPEVVVTHGIRREAVLWYALVHDIDESVTGDIPGIAKRWMRSKRDIPDLVPDTPSAGVTLDEMRIVKLADVIDAYTWIKVNGIGQHACEAAQWLKDHKLYKALDECGGVIDNQGQILDLITNIVLQKGRLRTDADYDPNA